MDSYSNKINRIKFTIDEIRDDIEKMKMKNEKTINTMMTSFNPNQVQAEENNFDNNVPQNSYPPSDNNYLQGNSNNFNQIEDIATIQSLPEDKKEELYKKYETVDSGTEYYQEQKNIPQFSGQQKQFTSIQENDYSGPEEDEVQNYEQKNYLSSENQLSDEGDNPNTKSGEIYTSSQIPKIVRNRSDISSGNSGTNSGIGGFNFRQKESLGQKPPTYDFGNKYKTNFNELDNHLESNTNTQMMNEEMNRYQEEIASLKLKVDSLQSQNELLSREVQAEQKKSELMLQKQKDQLDQERNLIGDIMGYLNVSSPEEILPRLSGILENKGVTNMSSPHERLKEELVEKLKSLYIALTGTEDSSEIEIKTIWRWIKHLINTVRDLAQEKEDNAHLLQDMQDAVEYRNYCSFLMKNFRLNNLEELKNFINNVLSSKDNDKQNEYY